MLSHDGDESDVFVYEFGYGFLDMQGNALGGKRVLMAVAHGEGRFWLGIVSVLEFNGDTLGHSLPFYSVCTAASFMVLL